MTKIEEIKAMSIEETADYEKALDFLEGVLSDRGYFSEEKQYLETAIEALEKQIPVPPVNEVKEKYRALGKNYWCKCGVMFVDWENYKTNYCGNCGQKLRGAEHETNSI